MLDRDLNLKVEELVFGKDIIFMKEPFKRMDRLDSPHNNTVVWDSPIGHYVTEKEEFRWRTDFKWATRQRDPRPFTDSLEYAWEIVEFGINKGFSFDLKFDAEEKESYKKWRASFTEIKKDPSGTTGTAYCHIGHSEKPFNSVCLAMLHYFGFEV